ncbi:TerC family protein [Bacillus sp. FSL K6-3431]|uniref:TerC family protein n=1 Tax=Bacillus sp. FSL K6-3431 TaxID=2921500 RepID=UPI0030F62B5F
MELASILGITVSSAAMIALLKIIAIDVILSGDNAIVIAMATRNLPKEQQNKAIVWGTAGAVVLRILFAVIIVWLLKIPFVDIAGGLLLLFIAYKVLVGDEEDAHISAHTGLMKAIGTIILADVVMSLDNVVAVAGAANGHITMIAIGVAISIPIMIFGSKFIVMAMNKYNWIGYVGSGILAWTAGGMILRDEQLVDFLGITSGVVTYTIIILITILVLGAGYLAKKKAISKRKVKQYS